MPEIMMMELDKMKAKLGNFLLESLHKGIPRTHVDDFETELTISGLRRRSTLS